MSVHVDNADKQFDLGMILSRLDPARMDGDQIQVEVYSRNERGVLGWHPTYDRLGVPAPAHGAATPRTARSGGDATQTRKDGSVDEGELWWTASTKCKAKYRHANRTWSHPARGSRSRRMRRRPSTT
ncbi:hypothetical protein ACFWWA_31285 [Streptomyces goshikiensis]|uniref:hypothetical protein n=1 Tax=Streptomyces goshikiensis TaxID=1942 RepID=UPI00365CB064